MRSSGERRHASERVDAQVACLSLLSPIDPHSLIDEARMLKSDVRR
jgi:hypothetical protein